MEAIVKQLKKNKKKNPKHKSNKVKSHKYQDL